MYIIAIMQECSDSIPNALELLLSCTKSSISWLPLQVVCSECHHVSVTYEPFMYLSVPLPHAMERQLSRSSEGHWGHRSSVNSLRPGAFFIFIFNQYSYFRA